MKKMALVASLFLIVSAVLVLSLTGVLGGDGNNIVDTPNNGSSQPPSNNGSSETPNGSIQPPDSEYDENVQQGLISAMKDYFFNTTEDVVVELTGSAPGGSGEGSNGKYFEVTDNQVEGIIEGDLAKATDKYIFRISGRTLYVYSVDKESSTLISQLDIPAYEEESNDLNDTDLFLSNDGMTLTLFREYRCESGPDKTSVVSIDLSDVTSPKIAKELSVGSYKNSVRKIGDKFYLITNWSFSKNRIDLDDAKSFIPSITSAEERHVCSEENIVYPEEIKSVSYRYITVFEEGSLELVDEIALMNFGGAARFTENYIIFDAQYYTTVQLDEKSVNRCFSRITTVDISGDKMEYGGKFVIEGWAKDQYSFDERDGYLRIVVSTSDRAGYTTRMDNASLYVYDLSDNSLVTSVEKFAPYGEGATAVRFDDNKLYVCTAETLTYTDPVYFFDLSDYANITYVDTGFIDGFSTSLIELGEGYLLGVGYGAGGINKIEVYKREGDGVVSVASYTFYGTVSLDYKSFFINREENLFGFGVKNYQAPESSTKKNAFIILKFEGEELIVVNEIETTGDSYSRLRTLYLDGYIYITMNKEFYFQKLWS